MQTFQFRRTTPHHIFSLKNLPSLSALIGAVGFMLSLLMSLGSPALLALWLGAALATLAFMRMHHKWRAMFERIYAAHPAQTVLAARKDWRGNVEDVVFREMSA
ncbi:MAG TPA: hypothetical protein VJ652_16115 [Noviherbaspirillum sp.]|nr:hypothetical protein [Noviherbaspirillum sp.]